MGCQQTKEETDDEVDIDPRNVPSSEEDYPPPYVPDSHKNEPEDTEYRRKLLERIANIPATTTASYNGLLKYLSEGAESETHHMTAIYYWMKSQDYDDPGLDLERTGNTPRGYMKMIKEGEADLCTFFTILCRRSLLPCVMLDGIGKDSDYTIGTSEQDMATRWNAVFVDDEWRIVHIEWAIEGSRDGNQNNNPVQNTSDFFFLVDPQDFAYMCHPDNHRWQLLHKPVTKKEFLAYPVLRTRFFELNMAVVEPATGRMKTWNGRQTIELAFPKKTGERLRLRYLLTEYIPASSEVEKPPPKKGKLNRFVFVIRKPTKVVFEIVLPESGRYTFDVFSNEVVKQTEQPPHTHDQVRDKATDAEHTDGNDLENDNEGPISRRQSMTIQTVKESLCQFRIISEKNQEGEMHEPLPECPDIGWGPGPECRDLGLVPLTHLDSYIYIRPGETRDIRFKKTKDNEVQCKLTHNFLPVYELVEQVSCTETEKEATITVQIRDESTYALVVYARETGTREYHEACYYLLKQQTKSRLPEKYRDKMLRSRLEYHIDHHTSERDLLEALEVFECYNCPDNGERSRATIKIKQYWEVKRELEGATRGRNKTALRKWIDRAKRSPYREDLVEQINRAELTEGRVIQQGYLHPIAKMDHYTITEIHNYKHPPPVVHDVMTSTYILLGENKHYLTEWSEIQTLMGKKGKGSLQKRIIARTPDDVTLEEVDDADAIIEPYSLQKCHVVSTGVATFYRWCKQFSNDARQKYLAEDERQESRDQLAGRETFRDLEINTAELFRNDAERQESRYQLVGRETFREPDTNAAEKSQLSERDPPLDTGNDRSSPKGTRKSASDEAEVGNHPFGVNSKDYVIPRPRFVSQSPTKSTRDEVQPVAYAGFKPQEMSSKDDEISRPKFSQSPTKNTRDEVKPIAYAGFKPPEMSPKDDEKPRPQFLSQSPTKDTGEEVKPIADAWFKPQNMSSKDDEIPRPQFLSQSPTKDTRDDVKPVAYAGFKPQEMDN